jgi:hypothetical protein
MVCVSSYELCDGLTHSRVAKQMLERRFPVHAIARVTGLSVEMIGQLQWEITEAIAAEFRGQVIQGSEKTQMIKAEILAASRSTIMQPIAYGERSWAEVEARAS